MALPASGSITIDMIAEELGVSVPLGLTDANVRILAGKPTGNVVLPTDFYLKDWFPGATLATGTISGSGLTDGLISVTASGSDSVNVSGGISPYTYQWTVFPSLGDTPAASGTTTATLTLSYTSTSPAYLTGSYNCSVTGQGGTNVTTANGSYSLEINEL